MPGDKDQGIERCQTRGEHGENPISNMIFLIKKEQGKDAMLDGRAKPRSPALKVDFPSVFSSGTVSSSAAVSGPFPFRVGWYEQGTSLSCFGGPLGLLPSFWDFLSSLFCFQLSVPSLCLTSCGPHHDAVKESQSAFCRYHCAFSRQHSAYLL